MAGGAVFVGGGATVVMDPPSVVYVNVFKEGSGPARALWKKAEAVATRARELAPVRSGLLASSINYNQNRDEKGNYSFGYAVSANTPYAFYVHEGTGPSPRWPDSRKVMKWPGSRGDVAYRDFVMHPGTPAVPFLRDALVAMVL